METQRCSRGWRKYLTSSTLILAVVIILIIFKTIFAIERESVRLNNFLEKKVVVQINDEIVVSKPLKTDTLNIYFKKYIQSKEELEVVDTTKLDTIILDTTTLKH